MKKFWVGLTFFILILIAAIHIYRNHDPLQKYYRSAEPMITSYQENQGIFHAAAETLSEFVDIGQIGIAKAPMEYIRDGYGHEHKIEEYSILTDTPLETSEYDRIFSAVSAIMEATDVSAFYMDVDDELGVSISFIFYCDYGVYAQLYYFEAAQKTFPYSPAYPKDIQAIDDHWYACLSTDGFMAG